MVRDEECFCSVDLTVLTNATDAGIAQQEKKTKHTNATHVVFPGQFRLL